MGSEETGIPPSGNGSKGRESEITMTRIMLVDDEPDINAALKVVLTRAGFSVDTFEDPSYALKMLEPRMYDLVILDLKMPKMDGFELYQEIKKIDKDTKICFLTASELFFEKLREKKFATLDKNLFIRKPIPNADLLKKINTILNRDPTAII
jgi:DNA-binding response OmpR family regulator